MLFVECVSTQPILVTTMGVTKLLEISKISAGTGQAEVEAVNSAILKWELEDAVRGMCFDTTSSNTGRLSGACIILEKQLGLPLLHFGCRHYILELVLAAAFGVCIRPSKAPDVILFKHFQGQWSSIEKED